MLHLLILTSVSARLWPLFIGIVSSISTIHMHVVQLIKLSRPIGNGLKFNISYNTYYLGQIPQLNNSSSSYGQALITTYQAKVRLNVSYMGCI